VVWYALGPIPNPIPIPDPRLDGVSSGIGVGFGIGMVWGGHCEIRATRYADIARRAALG